MSGRGLVLFLLLSFLITGSLESKVLNFEGSIKFIKETVFDTSYVVIYVKGEKMRVDEVNSRKTVIQSLLIDLNRAQVIVLSPSKKLFKEIPIQSNTNQTPEDFEIIKTQNRMQFNGETCYQWRVKDISRNTEVTYWVSDFEYDFFPQLLKIFRNPEAGFRLFSYIPDFQGNIPVLTVERTILRKKKTEIELAEVNKRELNDKLFRIPPGYQKIVL